MKKRDIQLKIELLLEFARQHNMLAMEDEDYIRNTLLDLFDLKEPYSGDIHQEEIQNIQDILTPLLDYGYEIGLIPENTITYRDMLDGKIMGIVMPRPSAVVRLFKEIAQKEGVEKATSDFYNLSIHSNYIRMDRIGKNKYWRSPSKFGELEITINLSKPEKDPKEIERAKNAPQSSYPKCLLCRENVGFSGNLNHPARQNLRIIPLEMAGGKWYFQYSPYVYYNEHSIIFYEKHEPMSITSNTFMRLLAFIEQFPHYFIGSNADLPIVGGSILSHEHYQGGRHDFPMAVASIEKYFEHKEYPGVTIGIVNWPLSVIRISSDTSEQLISLATHILELWREYSDPDVDILAYSEMGGEKTPHNTITPIARKNKKGEYELDLTLRNNRRSDEHPDGIFHPHQELHHIKKENIGLIEVMGLAILPGRLNEELDKIASILSSGNVGSAFPVELEKHKEWIRQIRNLHGTQMSKEQAEKVIQYEVGNKFTQVLSHAGVYKCNKKGRKAFESFLDHIGCYKKD